MIKHKYGSMWKICLAGILLSIFRQGTIKDYYMTCCIIDKQVTYWHFQKHHWIRTEIPQYGPDPRASTITEEIPDVQ